MKTIIYYFTGTGNSLAAARKIAAGLGDCEVVPIASLQDTQGDILPGADRVGIVCPVYFTGLPAMVASFAGRLDLSRSHYTFSVVTLGGFGGQSALRQLAGILKDRPGRGPDAGFMVKMPSNYILLYEPPAGKKCKEILSAAHAQLESIAQAVNNSVKTAPGYSPLAQLVHFLFYSRFASHVHADDRKFSVNDQCTSCGTCAAICPAKNIELVDGRPVWKHHCELCCGCIHLCPVEAIQGGKKTAGRVRYRNPEIDNADFTAQKGERP
jgi:ferredoxin